MEAIASRSTRFTSKLKAAALAIALLLPFPGCKSTYQTDKKRLIIFTFGVGLTFMSDKEAEVEVETKASTKPVGKGAK